MTWFGNRTGKFNNQKTEYKGRIYDSKSEAWLAMELDALVKQGHFIKVEPQVVFNLYGKNGDKVCTHRPDFLITKKDGTQEVWEYKGQPSEPLWRLKLKLFTDNYRNIPYWIVTSKERYYFTDKKR